jgi:hypothetical protein
MTPIKYDCDICKKVYYTEKKYNEMTEISQSYFAICDLDFHKGMVCKDCYKNNPALAQEIIEFLEDQ